MSNVDLISSLYRAFANGDAPAVLASLDPEIEWRTPTALPWSRGSYRGRAGVEEYFTDFLTALEEPGIEPQRLVADGDTVVAIGHERATSRTTGRRFEARFAHVWTVRDDRVTSMEGIIDTAAVLQAFEPAPDPEPLARSLG